MNTDKKHQTTSIMIRSDIYESQLHLSDVGASHAACGPNCKRDENNFNNAETFQ